MGGWDSERLQVSIGLLWFYSTKVQAKMSEMEGVRMPWKL